MCLNATGEAAPREGQEIVSCHQTVWETHHSLEGVRRGEWCVCVCVCVHAYVCACVHVCVGLPVNTCNSGSISTVLTFAAGVTICDTHCYATSD